MHPPPILYWNCKKTCRYFFFIAVLYFFNIYGFVLKSVCFMMHLYCVSGSWSLPSMLPVVWPGVSLWVQFVECVLILQIAMCEIHPTCSWGNSRITQSETASCILPLFFHLTVLHGRLGPCSCGALWWKPIRQIWEECSRGALIPACQGTLQPHINISVMLAWRSLWIVIFLFLYECSRGRFDCSRWEKITALH